MQGEIFQPWPSSRPALAPSPSVAMPPFPLAPSKFSGLMERVSAWERRERLPRFMPRPSNEMFMVFLLVVVVEKMSQSRISEGDRFCQLVVRGLSDFQLGIDNRQEACYYGNVTTRANHHSKKSKWFGKEA